MVTMVEQSHTPGTFDVAWKQPVRDGLRLKLTLVFPETCTAGTPTMDVLPDAVVERWTLRCETPNGPDWIAADGLDRTLTDIFVEVRHSAATNSPEVTFTGVLRGGASALSLTGGEGIGRTLPAASFFRLGIEHIVFGYDHLLFVLGLMALVRVRQLLLTLTAFTLGHSLTLGLATLGVAGLPGPPVEIVIALSLVLLAVEGVKRYRGEAGLTARWPWGVAAGFGLVHGFGFAGALGDIGLPEGEALWALALFNLGVEAGQGLVCLAVLGIGWAVHRIGAAGEGQLRLAAAYLVGTAGTVWAIERAMGVVV